MSQVSCHLVLAAAAFCVAAAELLFKKGADATASTDAIPGVSILASLWTWLGIVFYIGSFLAWIQALRRMPLHRAFSLMSVVHVLVPLGSWLFLGEAVNVQRCWGIFVVLCGVVIIAGAAVEAEEKL